MLLKISSLLWLALLMALPSPALSATFSFKVKSVDGNGLIVGQEGQSRQMAGVELPLVPIDQRLRRKEKGLVMDDTITFLQQQLSGKEVRAEEDPQQKDAQGQAAVYVYLADGSLFNQKLLEDGVAAARKDADYAKYAEFEAAQNQAIMAGRGVWAKGAEASQRPRSVVGSINNLARTSDFVERYQGSAAEEGAQGAPGPAAASAPQSKQP